MYLCGDMERAWGENLLQRNKINELSATQSCKSLTSPAPDDLIQIIVLALSLLLALKFSESQ